MCTLSSTTQSTSAPDRCCPLLSHFNYRLRISWTGPISLSKLPLYVWGPGPRLMHGFSSPPQLHIPNGILIGSAVFAQLMAECRWACPGMFFPLKIDPSHWGSGLGSGPHLMRASLGPPESITQTVSRSVQPFLRSSCHSVVRHIGICPSPQNCLLPWVIYLDPNPIHGSLSPPKSI